MLINFDELVEDQYYLVREKYSNLYVRMHFAKMVRDKKDKYGDKLLFYFNKEDELDPDYFEIYADEIADIKEIKNRV